MNTQPTPETDKNTYSRHQESCPKDVVPALICRRLERERDEARRLAEKYRNLSCDSQYEADETLLPWETTNPNEL
jgi:hypothetical protein